MATVKCRICGKSILKEEAYKIEHISKTGRKTNQYYCSKEEYEEREKEKEFYKECQFKIDDIMGYEVVNNVRNKFLSELNKAGYSYEKIYNCINDNYKLIENAMVLKRNEFANEYNMIAYMFGIIKKEIKDYKEVVVNNEVESVETIHEYKRNKPNKSKKPTLMDLIRENGGKNGK